MNAGLAAILEVSQRNNRLMGLTGALLVSRARFFQVLEGREDRVRATYARIADDARHSDLQPIWSAGVAGRLFENWAMVAARIAPDRAAAIDRVIDLSADYPHAAIGCLLDLVTRQHR